MTKTNLVEISTLPQHPSGFQREYIDDFYKAQDKGKEFFIGGKRVVAAYYGHCMEYPRGFSIEFASE